MIIIFNFIRQFRHDHQKAVAQSCISKVVQTYYIGTEPSLHLSFCLSFCFCLFLVVESVFVFAEGGTNQGEGNNSVFIFVSSSFFCICRRWRKPIISGLHHLLLLTDTFTSILRDALPSLSGPPAIM